MAKRILIAGCPGSGKSTFAKSLSRRLELPLTHLDQLYWRPGWVHVDRAEFDSLLDSVLQKDAWILDGNYMRTLPRRMAACDTAVYLDFPRRTCLLGVLRRVLAGYGRCRDDMGEGCPERLDLSFMKWIWDFHRKERPQCMEILESARPDQQVFILHSRKELPGLLEKLEQQRRYERDNER